jgi:hypothetical protein
MAGQWVVSNRFNYPADFSKIADFVKKLKEAKVGRHFESSEEILKRLSLKELDDPGATEQEKGTQILIKDESEKLLASLLLGKARKPAGEDSFSDGHYLRLSKDPEIYLIGANFDYLEKEPSAWLEKLLVNVNEKNVEKIICLSADGKNQRYLFESQDKEKRMALAGLPPGRKIKNSLLSPLFNGISELKIDDITDPSIDIASSGMKFTDRIEYHLFNGMVYRLYPEKECSEDKPCHLKLEVGYQQPGSPKQEPPDKQATEKGATEKSPEEMAIEAKQLNERFSPWVYVIPEWQHNAFITTFEDLLEKPDQEPST